MIPNQTSTRFIHDAEVGEMHMDTWVGGEPVSDFDPFVRGVVVLHQVQLALG
jgi:hypothetical protein